MRVTCADIARAMGLSVATVSRVLSGTYERVGISKERARRVREMAETMGYHPNAAARATVTGKFGAFALIRGEHFGPSHLDEALLHGLNQALGQHNIRLYLDILPDSVLTDARRIPTVMRSWSVDGVLLNYTTGAPEPLRLFFRNADLPVVWLNTDEPTDAVLADDFAASRLAVERLLRCGHRDIVYVNTLHQRKPHTEPAHYSTRERERGYRHAMREAGLTPRVWRPDVVRNDCANIRQCERWLGKTPRPTAVLAYERYVAVPIMMAARGVGLQVPRDLSILCFSDDQDGDLRIRFSAYLVPSQAMAMEAVAMLVDKSANPRGHRSLPSRRMPFGFQDGETLAPPRE